jgi:protein required for attachment to host cells
MKTTWIVAADASRARVLQVASPEKLVEIESLPDAPAAVSLARRVGDYLEKARSDHRYDQLVVIAPPKFLGALHKELGKEVEKLIADEVPKDLSSLSQRELEGYFTKDGRSL